MTERLEAPQLPVVPSLDLLAIDWHSADRSRARAGTSARPWSHRLAGSVATFHAAAPSTVAVLADLLVLAVVTCAVSAGSLQARLAFSVAVVAMSVLCQGYADRDSVQTRGIGWYPRLLALPLTVVGAGCVVAHLMPLGTAAATAGLALAALTGARALSGMWLAVARRRGVGLRPTLVIGSEESARNVARRLLAFPEAGLEPVHRLGYHEAARPGAVERVMSRRRVGHVVLVAPGEGQSALPARLPRQARDAPYVSVVPALTALYVDPRSATEVGGVPLVPLGRPTRVRTRFPCKRLLDVVGSATLLLLAAPLLALVAVAVRLGDGGPALFRQPRVGRDGTPFDILKFRTMVVGADQMQQSLAAANVTDGLLFKVAEDPRVTRVGRLLRRTSVDELPQLWNVLRGQMSLVGPRPLAVEPHAFTAEEAERHSVRPGITGYWQLSGGNDLTYAEMVRLDLAYVRHWSLSLDLRLLLRTFPALVHRHGAV